MHASIALCLMMFGGYVYPETDITTIPLKDDFSSQVSLQDLEWKERTKTMPLPRVPTVDVQQPGDNTGPTDVYRGYHPAIPNSMENRPNATIPLPPIDQDATLTGEGRSNYGRSTYGQEGNGQGGYRPGAGYTSGMPRNDPYANMPQAGRYPVGGGYNSIQPPPGVQPTPSVANYTTNTTDSIPQMMSRYGLANSSNPGMNPSAGGVKPFSDYQAPSGYSKWSLLDAPTNNGTLNPYTAYVQPAQNQQNFNAHISEQISGVPTMPRYSSGSSGVEVPVGGNGLVNPNTFQNYRNYPTNQSPGYQNPANQYPANPYPSY